MRVGWAVAPEVLLHDATAARVLVVVPVGYGRIAAPAIPRAIAALASPVAEVTTAPA